jgi:hypothetical protein
MKWVISFLLFLLSTIAFGQDSTKSPFTVSGYAEVYYSYDFNKPVNNSKPQFIYSHNRSNEVNLNLGFLKGAYSSDWVRANLSFAAGTYITANYASEPDGLKNIYEANIGIRLSKKNNLWLDAGIMPSHIGWEGAVSKDDWTLTRSIAADNSPYFESGVKIGYTSKNEKWYLSVLILNGWQRIHRVNGNSTPAFGTQIIYKPSAKIIINSSTFSGNDKPDSVKQMRYFHDFYSIIQITGQLGITLGFDIGWEKRLLTNKWNNWFTPTLILRYTLGSKWAIAGRVEYFNDVKQVIIYTGTINGCHLYGASLNVDKLICNNVWWRNELKTLNSKNAIFQKGNALVKCEVSITTSFAINF